MAIKAIAFTTTARRSYRKLPPDVRDRIDKALHRYRETGAGDVKVMVGGTCARLRIGDFRAIFVETGDVIEVRAVGHRREIYR
ncbi:type II toxin-antitoxin system RelE family toxin [Pelagibacterium sediminicola]|uniref:type II toxin-antitoxin system RelE family toxin n=1 Tax=Pelagibacterium sediminicola TaxID=2248761 RepID=UPI001FED29AF|nr:type II toxin-antitoxin system RelE/ParE family toxin [Pelagibacterium sediminicola]